MLTLHIGRSSVELAKSLAIGILTVLLAVSLWQVSVVRADAIREQQDRQIVADVARRFAVALTTYDYAHPNVQLLAMEAVSSVAVQERARAASTDIVAASASSLGGVVDAIVTNLTASQADVLLETSQVVGGTYSETGTTLRGLLEVTVSQSGRGWMVIDFRWLLAPSGAV